MRIIKVIINVAIDVTLNICVHLLAVRGRKWALMFAERKGESPITAEIVVLFFFVINTIIQNCQISISSFL